MSYNVTNAVENWAVIRLFRTGHVLLAMWAMIAVACGPWICLGMVALFLVGIVQYWFISVPVFIGICLFFHIKSGPHYDQSYQYIAKGDGKHKGWFKVEYIGVNRDIKLTPLTDDFMQQKFGSKKAEGMLQYQLLIRERLKAYE